MASEKKQEALNLDRELTSSEVADILDEMIEIKQPVMISGQPGIGKSDVVAQVAKKKNRPLIDVRLVLMDPTDLRGIPFKRTNSATNEEEMVWAPAGMFPRDPNDNSIILLDEITAAPPSVQCAALQLVLNRQLGDYKLPDGVAILAAGNRVSDKTNAHRMPSALSNRFTHLKMKFDFPSWRDWAFDHGIDSDVIGFISAFPNKANTFDPKTNSEVFATPRTLAFASKILGSKLSESLKMEAIAGTCGDGWMMEFKKHREFSAHLPSAEDVFSGKVTKLAEKARKNVSLQHALITSLIYKLREYNAATSKKEGNGSLSTADWNKIVSNFMKFISIDDNIETEIAVMALNVLYKRYNVVFRAADIPEVRAFFAKNAKLLQFTHN